MKVVHENLVSIKIFTLLDHIMYEKVINIIDFRFQKDKSYQNCS